MTIATLNDASIMAGLFGEERDRTHVLDLTLELMVDAKANTTRVERVEVEVGAAGYYDKFRILGGRGRRVIDSDATTGYIMTAKCDQNVGTYAYKDPDWQAAAAHYVRAHLYNSFTAGLPPPEAAKVNIEVFATAPITPLMSLKSNQSAKGIAVHVLVKGVDIMGDDEADGLGLAKAQPVSLRAMLPNGKITEDGTTPCVEKTPFRLAVPGVTLKHQNGSVVFPSQVKAAMEEYRAAQQAYASGAHGTPPPAAPAFGNMSTYKRREMRNAKGWHGAKGGKRRQGEAEEGEMSDGASSVASKLARGVRGMHAHDEGDLR